MDPAFENPDPENDAALGEHVASSRVRHWLKRSVMIFKEIYFFNLFLI